MTTQTQDIMAYLARHGSITPLQALRDLGCFRLAARIYDIERQGIEIPRKTIEVKGRVNGKTCRITQYERPKGQQELF